MAASISRILGCSSTYCRYNFLFTTLTVKDSGQRIQNELKDILNVTTYQSDSKKTNSVETKKFISIMKNQFDFEIC